MMNGLNSSSAMSFGRPHWCRLQRRAGHDHRAARVVHALAEQVLAEAALLALEHVAQRLQRAVARARDGPAAAAVVEQRVDGLLQHALLVVDDDLRRAEVEQPLEAVVAVDDAAVEVVEVRGREAAAVELDHRAQLRRDHRHGLEHHHLGLVAGVQEGREDLQALDRAGLLLALAVLDLVLEVLALVLEADARRVPRGEVLARRRGRRRRRASRLSRSQLAFSRSSSRTCSAPMPPPKYSPKPNGEPKRCLSSRKKVSSGDDQLGPELVLLDRLLGVGAQRPVLALRGRLLGRLLLVGEELPDVLEALARVLVVGLGVVDVGVERACWSVLDELLALLVGELLDVDVERLGPQVVLVAEAGLAAGLQVLDARLERLLAARRRAPSPPRRRRSSSACISPSSVGRSRQRASWSTQVTIEAAK